MSEPTIVQRSGWNARTPSGATHVPLSERRGIGIHHTAGPTSQTVRQIQNYHMDGRGWSDIGYNFLVDQQGHIYVGRGWTTFGAHAAPNNRTHLGFCWIGDGRNTAPTDAAKSSMRWLVDEARRRTGRTLTVAGHGQLSGQSTECPSAHWRAWIADGMPGGQPPPPPEPERSWLDMASKDDVKDAVREVLHDPASGITSVDGTAWSFRYTAERTWHRLHSDIHLTLQVLYRVLANSNAAMVQYPHNDGQGSVRYAAERGWLQSWRGRQGVDALTAMFTDFIANGLDLDAEQLLADVENSVKSGVTEGLAEQADAFATAVLDAIGGDVEVSEDAIVSAFERVLREGVGAALAAEDGDA